MLELLCKLNGQQGGTIHQFFSNPYADNVLDMRKAFNDFTRMGIEFPSKASLEKLAKQYQVTILWNKD